MRLCRRCDGFQDIDHFILFAFVLVVLASNFSSAEVLTCPASGLWANSGVSASSIPRPVFPTGNKVRTVFGKELNKLLSVGKDEGHNSRPRALVVLFYLAEDPPSMAITPVYRCLASFFPQEVQFVMAPYAGMSLMALMSQGLHALPVLQVNAHGRKYRYSGKHRLGPMLLFVSRALAQEPVAGLGIAHFCSKGNPSTPATGHLVNTCRRPSLWEMAASSNGSATQLVQQCTQENMCRSLWECTRWDGEVTLQELKSRRPSALFYFSLAFVVLRCIWEFHQWWCTRCASVSGAAAAAGGRDSNALNAGVGVALDAAGIGSHDVVGPAAQAGGLAR